MYLFGETFSSVAVGFGGPARGPELSVCHLEGGWGQHPSRRWVLWWAAQVVGADGRPMLNGHWGAEVDTWLSPALEDRALGTEDRGGGAPRTPRAARSLDVWPRAAP